LIERLSISSAGASVSQALFTMNPRRGSAGSARAETADEADFGAHPASSVRARAIEDATQQKAKMNDY
jgi:hypothetical protein